MKSKFLRTLIVFLASFGATFVSVSFGDLSDLNQPNIQGEMLNKSAESAIAHRGEQVIYFSRFVNLTRGNYLPSFIAVTPSPTLAAFTTCVLLC